MKILPPSNISFYVFLNCFIWNSHTEGFNCLPSASAPPSGYSIQHCPDGWTRFKKEKCFKLMTDLKSFTEAGVSCKGIGSTLASIQSDEESQFINSLTIREIQADKLVDVWIGGNRVSGVWYWADLSPFSYSNWWPGYPLKENCLRICSGVSNNALPSRGKMADIVCSTNLSYICQKYQTDTRKVQLEV